MANFYGNSRTNYFRVKDAEAFLAEMKAFSVEVWNDCTDASLFAIAPPDCNDGFWPSEAYASDADGDDVLIDIDFIGDVIPAHLADGEIAVLMTVGSEKLRYLEGWAVAIDNTGRRIEVNIDDIYAKAELFFGSEPTRAQY